MAARRLVSPDQAPAVRMILGAYEFLASLRFAVVLIALLAVVLGLGTFVESGYGTEAVKFGVWNTWWFTLLNALLAVSIFCAAAIRYPWKRHQTGFVITHIGLLVLLAGCLMSQRGGVDAQIPLLEGEQGSKAYEDSHHFVLEIAPADGGSPIRSEPIEFRSGPFNWREYWRERWWFPWGLVPRDTGVVHDADGVRLEVLDFYADSVDALAPSVKLRIGSDSFAGGGDRGVWMPAELGSAGARPSAWISAALSLEGGRERMESRETEAIEARASPRKPRVAMRSRSSTLRTLLVAWGARARGS
jgi:hypothetical protein